MTQDANHLIWIDMEMTGLAPDRDRIIEVALVITDGNLATASVPYSNANKTTTKGIDFDVTQTLHAGALGDFEASISWTYIMEFRKLLEDGTRLDYVGTSGPYVLSSATGTPRNRGSFTLSWNHNNVSVTGKINYVGSMALIDHQGVTLVDNGDGSFSTTGGEGTAWVVQGGVDGGPACGVYTPAGLPFHGCQSGSFTTIDIYAKLKLSEHAELNGSIRNLANTMAPFNPYTYGGFNYNPAWTQDGAVGRYFNVGGRYKF